MFPYVFYRDAARDASECLMFRLGSIAAPAADELEKQLNCPLVVIGGELADRLGLANHLIDQKRCTIVVYGASVLTPPAARADTAEASVVSNRRRDA